MFLRLLGWTSGTAKVYTVPVSTIVRDKVWEKRGGVIKKGLYFEIKQDRTRIVFGLFSRGHPLIV